MRHSKLPWSIGGKRPYIIAKTDSGHNRKCLITTGVEKPGVGTYNIGDDEVNEANANLIVTAVNVMPEVKRVLKRIIGTELEPETKRCRVCGWKEHDDICYVKHTEKLLLELEAADGIDT